MEASVPGCICSSLCGNSSHRHVWVDCRSNAGMPTIPCLLNWGHPTDVRRKWKIPYVVSECIKIGVYVIRNDTWLTGRWLGKGRQSNFEDNGTLIGNGGQHLKVTYMLWCVCDDKIKERWTLAASGRISSWGVVDELDESKPVSWFE